MNNLQRVHQRRKIIKNIRGDLIMDFEKLISERYSVRKFKQQHLPQDVIDKIP